VNLVVQLFTSAVLIVAMTLVHASGITLIGKSLVQGHATPQLGMRSVVLMSWIALSLFALHAIEIILFSLFYLAVGALRGVEEAIFFSAAAYTTLAQPDASFPLEWRVVGALEGLAGFLLIGWSTAVFVSEMDRLMKRKTPG
jgi:hypothetical protein